MSTHDARTPPPISLDNELDVDALLGTLVDTRYLIVKQLGWGGMGVVYQAEDQRLHSRPCALKVLNHHATTAEEDARFARELRIISKLRSPNTVQVFDTGALPDGRPYIAMEQLEGQTLSALLRSRGPFPSKQAVRIIEGILVALDEAHAEGIVHRDLKPANVLLVESGSGRFHPKVLDFGIAAELYAGQVQGQTVVGTPAYMAPEQFTRGHIDPRTDLYALGVIFYRMLSGQLPFQRNASLPPEAPRGMTPGQAMAWMHLNLKPQPLPGLPEPLWRILERLLAKSPEQRFGSATEVTAALRELVRRGYLLQTGDEDGQVSFPWDPNRHLKASRELITPVSAPFVGESSSVTTTPKAPGNTGFKLIAGVSLMALVFFATQRDHPPEAPPKTPPPTATTMPQQPVPMPASPDMCSHIIRTVPSGAHLHRGARDLGVTPKKLRRPCDAHWVIRVSAPGHASTLITLNDQTALGDFPMLTLEAAAPPLQVEPPKPTTHKSASTSSKRKVRKRRRARSKAAPKKFAARTPTPPMAEDAPAVAAPATSTPQVKLPVPTQSPEPAPRQAPPKTAPKAPSPSDPLPF
ncbi:MAG: protein kinase domain-containing protein [Bradymonadia bacterium]